MVMALGGGGEGVRSVWLGEGEARRQGGTEGGREGREGLQTDNIERKRRRGKSYREGEKGRHI